jgi:glucose-6-phosphate dehydrogenase assembly protein OpcA
MAPDVAGLERIAERVMPVDPQAIERAFDAIWQETSGGAFDASSIRLRVLNLVAFSHTQGAEVRFARVMEAVSARHPCRAILALAGDHQGRLEATVGARCWRANGGGRHVCTEEVRLAGGTQQQPELASAVLALIVPELPVAIWLMDQPDLGGRMSREVMEAADRVFFDSGADADVIGTFDHVLRSAQEFELELSDLAWGRIATWRALIAQFFDGEGLKEISRIASIEIDAGGAALRSEALLVAGWLMSRLDLSIADLDQADGRITATLYAGSRGVTLTVGHSHKYGNEPVHEVRIRTAGAALSVGIHEESAHMHVREEWEGAPARRTVGALPGDDASVIALALDDYADPKIYAEALGSALALLGS